MCDDLIKIKNAINMRSMAFNQVLLNRKSIPLTRKCISALYVFFDTRNRYVCDVATVPLN